MSRYEFKTSKNAIVVGWDRPLSTFFTQVWDGGNLEQGDLALWTGMTSGGVPTFKALEKSLKPFGKIPGDIAAEVRQDQYENLVMGIEPFEDRLDMAKDKYRIAEIALGRFTSLIYGRWNSLAGIWTYRTVAGCEDRVLSQNATTSYFRGFVRHIDKRGLDYLRDHMECGLKQSPIRSGADGVTDLEDLQDLFHSTMDLLDRFEKHGHENVLKDRHLEEGLLTQVESRATVISPEMTIKQRR
jgi:hypothetical protein